MYSHTYGERGELLLNIKPAGLGKEPRPVYASEMNLLGFQTQWVYENQDERPYMWAEANSYYYRGQLAAKLLGGNCKTPPKIQFFDLKLPNASCENLGQGELFFCENTDDASIKSVKMVLEPIDILSMVQKNAKFLELLTVSAQQLILETYERFKDTLDVFHVAFSGGKDSIVLLDLVKKTLPAGSYVVIFADTGMEFPDTYSVIRQVAAECKAEDIPFYKAKAKWNPVESWNSFGPPSCHLRWCCYVHKSAPQTLLLRKLLKKKDYTGLDFVGIRGSESLARSEYRHLCYSKKQRGQWSLNPILDWGAAEVWLYIFANELIINQAYKKGNARAGCLLCPMSGSLSNYFRCLSYKRDMEPYFNLVRDTYDTHTEDWETDKAQALKDSYLHNGGWRARRNGRDLVSNQNRVFSRLVDGYQIIEIHHPQSDWREWFKTLGTLQNDGEEYRVVVKGSVIPFTVQELEHGYRVKIESQLLKVHKEFGKYFRLLFYKAAYCIGCRVCESNCPFGALRFEEGKVKIENCCQCHKCYEIDDGCLVYSSMHMPLGTGVIKVGTSDKSLNTFADHAPKIEWLRLFFGTKQKFFTDHNLGPMMISKFKRFLSDAGLNYKNNFTEFAKFVSSVGWESELAWGLILSNLVYGSVDQSKRAPNPQMAWYTNFMDLEHRYAREELVGALKELGISDKDAASIVKAFKRLAATPLGTVLNWGRVEKKGKEEYLVRTAPKWGSPLVLLYSLFKFAEAMGGEYRAFNLGQLADPTAERQAVSPLRLWGATPAQLKAPLLGLNARYPEYIQVSFTHDLDSINLGPQSSAQVLELIQEV